MEVREKGASRTLDSAHFYAVLIYLVEARRRHNTEQCRILGADQDRREDGYAKKAFIIIFIDGHFESFGSRDSSPFHVAVKRRIVIVYSE